MSSFDARPVHDRPLAIGALTSYRYRGRYGWIMIGAMTVAEALSEAERSFSDPRETADRARLQVWSDRAGEYIDV